MRAFLILAVALSGCTTTAAHLGASAPAYSVESSKAPKILAACIADNMTGGDIRDEGDGHFAVVRSNNFGVIGRWDIYPAAQGSRAEWRRVGSLTTGEGAAKNCA